MIDFENENLRASDCKQALTLVFIEDQTFDSLFEVEDAFCKGTAFPELYKPFRPGGAAR